MLRIVQTFLPYPDAEATAEVLDDRRLGKQRVETLQILRALTWPEYGWKHHPAVKMWRGSEVALASYGLVICRQWVTRGYADTCAATIVTDLQDAGFDLQLDATDVAPADFPAWWGDARLHTSHQASLVRKDPSHYRPFFPDVDPDLPYWWPSQASEFNGGD